MTFPSDFYAQRQSGLALRTIAYGSDFWRRVAGALLSLEDVSSWVVLLPHLGLAKTLRQALAEEIARTAGVHSAVFMPRIDVLANWVKACAPRPVALTPQTRRMVELFGALRKTAWLSDRIGAGGGPLWSLARELLVVCDELTLSLGHSGLNAAPGEIEKRLLAVIKGTYRARAWDICSSETELVLQIWRSLLSRGDEAVELLAGLEELAQLAPSPLCVIAPFGVEGHTKAFLERYSQAQRVECISIDLARSLSCVPAVSSAWPELLEVTSGPLEPIGARAARLAGGGAPLIHLQLTGYHSLEDEAADAAQTVLTWLAAGRRHIGLVALDRLCARRVRALLERAQVLVRDEAGWKYSTATVSGSLMRWLELVGPNEALIEADVLLDWIKSPHALCGMEGKEAVVAALELAIRRENVARGLTRILATLGRERARVVGSLGDPGAPADQIEPHRHSRLATLDRTLDLIALLRRIAIPLRGRRSLADHFAWLDETLRTTQMAASFRTDAVGATLLEYLERLGSEALTAAKGEVFTFGEWRAFVADALENATFREDSVDSSVVALSLGAAAYRPFDAVLILGADASHFPGQLTEKLFLNQSVRAELGLPLASAAEREQLCQLALLMAATPEVAITWRKTLERQPNALAAPLQRLSILHKAAFGSDLIRNVQWDEWAVAMRSTHRPAPQAEDRLPDHLSASAYDRLVSCPYRYFVRYVLQVQPLDEMSEDADKRDYGEIVHRIFEEFHAVCAAPEPAFESVEKLRQISRAVFNREVGDNPAFLGYRQRFETVIEPYVRWWAEWTKQGWRFAQAELRRERVMMLQGAPSLLLNGRLDRLDEGPSGLAILDYKARSVSTLRRELKALTEEVQLPFYRLLVPDARRVRAGYLSVDQKEVQTVGLEVDIDRMALALSARIRHDFERLHRGAGLPANGADTTCAYCDERGLCRKGQWSESEGGPEGASGSPAA